MFCGVSSGAEKPEGKLGSVLNVQSLKTLALLGQTQNLFFRITDTDHK